MLNDNIRLLEDKWSKLNESEKQEFNSMMRERIELSKSFSKHHRKISNVIENEVRMKFGHKKVGEAWTSETILYYIVKKLFPQYTVHRHYRPSFLDGLELDIYIEENTAQHAALTEFKTIALEKIGTIADLAIVMGGDGFSWC